MGTVWITFATEDNVDGDVDYLAQELTRSGFRTRQHPLFPGEDEKIDRLMPVFLGRPDQSDAWILFGSETLFREGRADRIQQAVKKATDARGEFPRVGFFSSVLAATEANAISLTDRQFSDEVDWRQGLGEALGQTILQPDGEGLAPYVARLHPHAPDPYRYVFEFRPKLGTWNPFLFAILPEERDKVQPRIQSGPRGVLPQTQTSDFEEGFSDDAEWYYQRGNIPATPTISYFAYLREMPSRLAFGQEGTDEVVVLNLRTGH